MTGRALPPAGVPAVPGAAATEPIDGYAVSCLPLADCVARIRAGLLPGGRRLFLACANPHSLEVARRDAAFAAALRGADLLVPDGVGIVIASRILGGTIRERVTGSDVFAHLSRALDAAGGARYFFLGSTERTLGLIAARLAADYPRIRLAGSLAPPFAEAFSEEESRRMVEAVNASGADVLWVGMTAPKQEKWVAAHRDRLRVGFVGAVGAVFDFYAGTVPRSPQWFLDHGLEWLPRLLRQPGRLWRRNLLSNPAFLARVIRERLGARRAA